jgi:TolB-like protein/Flp pilus assembly protein TadD
VSERGFIHLHPAENTRYHRAMPPAESDSDAARQQLERVIESAGFSRNKRLAGFLRFVVEQHLLGNDDEIKESVIAIEVFGRGGDHDPRQDSIVRTEAARLRARLSEYYAGEGKSDPLIIELPKGGYAPVLRHLPTVPLPTIPSATGASPSAHTHFRLWAALAGFAVAGSVGGWWLLQHNAPIPIAVLPLTNLSQDPANDYFADGLTDEIIRNLSIIDGLAVRSQTSSFVFKGKPRNVREAGKQLEADYILEGSVLRDGQQLRIIAQLVRVRDDFPLWSGRYNRELPDVLAIQDEISRGIVNSLRLKLGRGRRRYEISSEIYDSYLQARDLSVDRGLQGINQSIGPLEQVVAKDPSFAPAYADLTAAYAARSGEFQFDMSKEESKMRAAAEKAIELDPLLAQAHYALGMIQARDAQWGQSEKSFRRAIELDPSRSETRRDFALFYLLPLGQMDESLRQLRAAEKSDPLSSVVHYDLAYALNSSNRYDEAADICARLPMDNPDRSWCLGKARLGQGRVGEAIQILETALNHGVSAGSQIRGELGYACGHAGRRGDAEKLISATPSINPFNQALIFAGLGDKDRTFEALDRAASAGPFRIGRALTFPEYALLRGDPRLKALRKRVGLPE